MHSNNATFSHAYMHVTISRHNVPLQGAASRQKIWILIQWAAPWAHNYESAARQTDRQTYMQTYRHVQHRSNRPHLECMHCVRQCLGVNNNNNNNNKKKKKKKKSWAFCFKKVYNNHLYNKSTRNLNNGVWAIQYDDRDAERRAVHLR